MSAPVLAPMQARRSLTPPLLGIVGPTASGKSDLALALSRRLPVEILVADSRQVYRGMDVGTAKPDAAVRAEVPHHLLDLADPSEPFTVADWVAAARDVLPGIASRGRLPMLVGGTGLYVAALLEGHDYDAQPWSPERRAELDERLASEGLEPLVAELTRVAPLVAASIDLRNPRRVLRALERATADEAEASPPRGEPYGGRVALVGVIRPREVLHRRIDARARWMFTEGGLIDEVRGLLAAGFGPELRPMTGHGYREAVRYLAGEWSLEEAVAVTARHTRQYAKRQLTWFRRERRLMWVGAGAEPADDPGVVDRAEGVLRAAIA